MRTIKFRGKRVDNGEWVYSFGIVCLPDVGVQMMSFSDDSTKDNVVFEWVDVIPETVGQLWSPSLKLEFYGGDLFTAICSVDDDGESDGTDKKERKVKISETNKGFKVSVWHLENWWSYRTMDFTSFKPIGNIHDK